MKIIKICFGDIQSSEKFGNWLLIKNFFYPKPKKLFKSDWRTNFLGSNVTMIGDVQGATEYITTELMLLLLITGYLL